MENITYKKLTYSKNKFNYSAFLDGLFVGRKGVEIPLTTNEVNEIVVKHLIEQCGMEEYFCIDKDKLSVLSRSDKEVTFSNFNALCQHVYNYFQTGKAPIVNDTYQFVGFVHDPLTEHKNLYRVIAMIEDQLWGKITYQNSTILRGDLLDGVETLDKAMIALDTLVEELLFDGITGIETLFLMRKRVGQLEDVHLSIDNSEVILCLKLNKELGDYEYFKLPDDLED